MPSIGNVLQVHEVTHKIAFHKLRFLFLSLGLYYFRYLIPSKTVWPLEIISQVNAQIGICPYMGKENS